MILVPISYYRDPKSYIEWVKPEQRAKKDYLLKNNEQALTPEHVKGLTDHYIELKRQRRLAKGDVSPAITLGGGAAVGGALGAIGRYGVLANNLADQKWNYHSKMSEEWYNQPLGKKSLKLDEFREAYKKIHPEPKLRGVGKNLAKAGLIGAAIGAGLMGAHNLSRDKIINTLSKYETARRDKALEKKVRKGYTAFTNRSGYNNMLGYSSSW